VEDTKKAIADGADEIDLVIPYRSFIAGDTEATAHMVSAVSAVIPRPTHLLKVATLSLPPYIPLIFLPFSRLLSDSPILRRSSSKRAS